ncbi:MAG TPA: hypothetical protein V6D33_16765, partial [Cyanophyceae cyanobacterium]
QIVYLEHETTRLYAEVIDVVASRQVCWVRPLMLAIATDEQNLLPFGTGENLILYNLQQLSDLLWPASLFRPALDTEVIPLLVQLDCPDTQPANNSEARQQLNSFVRQVWQAYKSAFK